MESTDAHFLSNAAPRRTSILFVCVGNTCRSVLGEYIARQRFGHVFEAASVGIQPQSAVETTSIIVILKELNIDASQHHPRSLQEVDPKAFDLVVTMDSSVTKKFTNMFPSYPRRRLKAWNITDPYDDNPAACRRCAREIYTQLTTLSETLGTAA
jgi:ArsR family transcriptional regulator, arsenate/arsenite/antimonite-responsive transcriptional repressor / arsenate reductase (thioredoxin)